MLFRARKSSRDCAIPHVGLGTAQCELGRLRLLKPTLWGQATRKMNHMGHDRTGNPRYRVIRH